MTKISVLMPLFNCENFVRRSVDSILCQTYENWELLICDDASTDSSMDIVRSYCDPRIKIFQNKQNLGYLKTCNYLFGISSGEYITFQDADDYSVDNRLEILISEMFADSQLMLCGSNYFRVVSGIYSSSSYPQDHSDIIDTILMRGNVPFCGASIMLRRQVIEDSLYDLFFTDLGFEDYYLILKIVFNYKSKNIITPLYHYTYNTFSITRFFYQDPRKLVVNKVLLKEFVERYNSDKNFNINYIVIDEKINFESELLNKTKMEQGKLNNLLYNFDFKNFFSLLSLRNFNLRIFVNFLYSLVRFCVKKYLTIIK